MVDNINSLESLDLIIIQDQDKNPGIKTLSMSVSRLDSGRVQFPYNITANWTTGVEVDEGTPMP